MESLMRPSYWLPAVMVIAYAGTVSAAYPAIEYADVAGGQVKGQASDGLAPFKAIPDE